MFLIISSIFAGGIQAGDWTDLDYVECTPLRGGDYGDRECILDCNQDNPDCYYGTGAPLPGQHCYCYTDKGLRRALITKDDIECTPLQGGTYAGCNAYCNFRNPDCYYGTGAASPSQICYCYTDNSNSKHETVKSIYKHKLVENNIECTPLEGGNYAQCNANCNFRNPDCYYGTGAASSDQICYCYTDKDLSTVKPTIKPSESKASDIECTPLEGGNYAECNANCYPGNFDCYYGTDAPLPGQHCYCYTDSSTSETVKPIKSTENNVIDDIECTPLQGGNYAQCNELCYEGNSDCYYGNGAASPGQTCYCYTNKYLSTMKPSESKVNDIECTPLQGGNYAQCNANCYPGNSDCYYGNGAASSDQHCYCYTGTDTGTAAAFPIPLPLRRALITEDDIECTPLEGGDYKVCNANCYEGNPDCYYGTDAALNGEHCYCYTDSFKSVKSIECTPLEGGNYADCNANCNVDNPDCYYGNGAASPGQICYCYSESRRRLIMVDDSCTGMIIGGLLISSIIIALIVFYYKQKKDVYLLSNIEFDKQNIV